MRTIKFRGKASHSGEWLYGDLINIHGEYHIFGEDDMREDGHHVTQDSDRPTWVEPDTIGQFTGLYDKNGKEIYEGDIVRHPYINPIFGGFFTSENEEDNPTSEVVFNESDFTLRFHDIHSYLCEFVRKNVAEVVGNVHDNPELLDK